MVELGTHTSASERRFALGWVGMAIVMSFAVAAIDFLELPLQTVYVFAAGVTLREAIGLAVWALRR
ncbi:MULTISPECIES: hypothetical protein [Haloferax]|jgi:hypothetical protein|uniref:Uncharacterized protein n=6 Tax=Haloferax TaxID=2251 RepID=D4GV90_HALVD|nr:MULTISPECIES: hypothetical protein [Haloferax]ADE04263.1 uncharacterized protein HVO_2157 [Haloferax volcanii DS2]ELK44238.1 hypothetical protein D320_21945 [Haloferax sp. BAB-2207]ELY33749.1 hypothetical protein C498_06073 [Haloferax volcanii DS2]ELZ55989.1 hypothetical protein C460_14565 [Haloferax sp. ATCC BAA-646]ELZ67744.1 hypothetical protein C459_01978 [Haloferax sp. ATCC BAA-645]